MSTSGIQPLEPVPRVAEPDVPVEFPWIVAHTRPRCEKKFANLLTAERFEHYLPLGKSIRRYGGRTKSFTKPIFPGYVFLRPDPELRARLFQQDLVVRLIKVEDQVLFLAQLETIRTMAEAGFEMHLVAMRKGARVRVVGGALHGVEGVVDNPDDPKGVIVAMDVLRQGVLVRLPRESIQVIG